MLWKVNITDKGYCQINVAGVRRVVHRVIYEGIIGKIPRGLELDHLCRVRNCVNPYHMEPVTGRENILRGEGAGAKNYRKKECKHGHPFSPENTHVTADGYRICKTCVKEYNRKRRENYVKASDRRGECA